MSRLDYYSAERASARSDRYWSNRDLDETFPLTTCAGCGDRGLSLDGDGLCVECAAEEEDDEEGRA